MKKNNISILLLIIVILFTSCHKRIDDNYLTKDSSDRKVGVEGGEIFFKHNYSNDQSDGVNDLFYMNIPEGVLDTTYIFNFYKFNNDSLIWRVLGDQGVFVASEFFYVLPFKEYINSPDSTNMYKLDKHISLYSYNSIDVTYYLHNDTMFNYWMDSYESSELNYELYRIKIPAYNEWATENIWTEYTKQGYPNGYLKQDLYYLISGMWTETDYWGEGEVSFDNWEYVKSVDLSWDRSVSFGIYETDYVYVIIMV